MTYSCFFPNKSLLKWQDYYADEIGVLSPNQMQVEELYAGEVKFPFWMTLIIMGFCVACLGCFLESKNIVFGRKLQNGLMILLYFDHILITDVFCVSDVIVHIILDPCICKFVISNHQQDCLWTQTQSRFVIKCLLISGLWSLCVCIHSCWNRTNLHKWSIF